MARDITADTLAVGNALTSVRIDNMILNLAKGIAWGQYELDKVGVDITKMMGVPGTVSIGGEKLSMLEAGFIPSFYHFVDTILEIKMEVNIREEESSSLSSSETTKRDSSSEKSASISVTGGVNVGWAKVEATAKAGFKQKSSSAYSKTVDANHSKKFSQDLSASSLMRTKIVPVPAPELLVERIKILLDKLREDAKAAEEEQLLFQIEYTDAIRDELDGNSTASISGQFTNEYALSSPTVTQLEKDDNQKGLKWKIADGTNHYLLIKEDTQITVYRADANGGDAPKSKDDFMGEMLGDQLFGFGG